MTRTSVIFPSPSPLGARRLCLRLYRRRFSTIALAPPRPPRPSPGSARFPWAHPRSSSDRPGNGLGDVQREQAGTAPARIRARVSRILPRRRNRASRRRNDYPPHRRDDLDLCGADQRIRMDFGLDPYGRACLSLGDVNTPGSVELGTLSTGYPGLELGGGGEKAPILFWYDLPEMPLAVVRRQDRVLWQLPSSRH